MTEAVLGKFLAAWCFAGIALVLTFPFWITVNFLGHPDNGVIVASYIGSWLMAGRAPRDRRLCLGGDQEPGHRLCRDRRPRLCLHCRGLAGGASGVLQGWAPEWLIRAFAEMSFLGHFSAITRGVIDLRDVAYFVSVMIAFLFANAILVDLEKGRVR